MSEMHCLNNCRNNTSPIGTFGSADGNDKHALRARPQNKAKMIGYQRSRATYVELSPNKHPLRFQGCGHFVIGAPLLTSPRPAPLNPSKQEPRFLELACKNQEMFCRNKNLTKKKQKRKTKICKSVSLPRTRCFKVVSLELKGGNFGLL